MNRAELHAAIAAAEINLARARAERESEANRESEVDDDDYFAAADRYPEVPTRRRSIAEQERADRGAIEAGGRDSLGSIQNPYG